MPITKAVGYGGSTLGSTLTPFEVAFDTLPADNISGPGGTPRAQVMSSTSSAALETVSTTGALLLKIPDGVVPTGATSVTVQMGLRGLPTAVVQPAVDAFAFATGTSASSFTTYGTVILITGGGFQEKNSSAGLSVSSIATTGFGLQWILDPDEISSTLVNGFVAKLTYTAPPPTVVSTSTLLLQYDAAVLGANLRTYEVSATTYLEYGTTSGTYTKRTDAFGTPAPSVAFPANEFVQPQYQLVGLEANTTYFARVVATTEGGTVNSSQFSFTTAEATAANQKIDRAY